jgi:hypothetical protein
MAAPPGTKEAALLARPQAPPNFTTSHSVLIPAPLDKVFAVLAPGDEMERVVRLSELCSDFFLLNADAVALSPTESLSSGVRVRGLSAAPTDEVREGKRLLPRQFFSYEEAIPVVGSLVKHKVRLAGCQTWDEEQKVALYESVGQDAGILIWKLREFEEAEGGTRVSERIEGSCPDAGKWIVERMTGKSHKYVGWLLVPKLCAYDIHRREHMEQFHTLFE